MTDIIQWDKHIARVPSYGAEAMAIQAPAYSSSLSIFLSLSLTCSFFPSHFALFPEYLLFLHSPAQGERVTLDSCDSYSIYLVNNPFSLNFLTFLFRPPPTPTTRIPVAFTDSRVSRASFSRPLSLESASHPSLTSSSFLSTPSSNMMLFQNLADGYELGEISLPLLTFWCGLNCALQTQMSKA